MRSVKSSQEVLSQEDPEEAIEAPLVPLRPAAQQEQLPQPTAKGEQAIQ
jgi:hypothetical protein